ncbi:MAG: putative cytokinetic ring protein SteA [Actinobacteria bacterium]|nr:putative cytokinetic ring protein SteA [Actinomycetota bacterium]
MRLSGTARIDSRTKDLVKRLSSDDIAIIDHQDIDKVSAEGLLGVGVECVINASRSISGAYPNTGPILLARGGVHILDDVGPAVFERIQDGAAINIIGHDVFLEGELIASGQWLTVESIESSMLEADSEMGAQLDSFVRNTLDYLENEKELLTGAIAVPETGIDLVFDEVDAGIGGATATAIGRRLSLLAEKHQVLVVTHLAQVAAFADRHLVVTKSVDSDGVRTQVDHVADEARIAEVARMLSGGSSETGLAHASELLASAKRSRTEGRKDALVGNR